MNGRIDDVMVETQPERGRLVRTWLRSPWNLAVLGLLFLVALPVFSLAYRAAGSSGDAWPHIIANVLPASTLVTVKLLVGTGVGVFAIGTTTAWLVTRYRFPLSNLFDWALVLPLAIPTYIAAYTWGELADYTGPVQTLLRGVAGFETSRDYWFPDVRSTGGAIFILSLVLFPYVYLPARLSFRLQGTAMLDAARLLGAGPVRLFFKVALPAARPAIAIGVILALMETLNDIGAVEYLGVRTLTFSIFDTWLKRSSLAGAAQLSLLLLVAVIGLVFLERHFRRERSFQTSRHDHAPIERPTLTGWKSAGAVSVCGLALFFGFLIPAGQLVRFSVRRPDQLFDGALGGAFVNTVGTAFLAALVATIAAFVLIYAARRTALPGYRRLVQLASVGYAIPGTILAIGMLGAMTAFDNSISALSERLLGHRTGLLISGSMAIIVYACSVRFLAVAIGNVEAGYEKISPNLMASARTLGQSERAALFSIELPLLAKALGIAFVIVFVETAKELSATLLLRPFNFDTLATFVYERASRAVFEQAGFAAMLIVATGLVPVYWLTRAINPVQYGAKKKANR